MRSAARLSATSVRISKRLEDICDRNTEKVLAAFAKNRVSDNLFAGTTGYGYDDYGRDTLDKIYADIFGTEAALVRIGFVNGTHALSCAMFSAVKTGDTVLSVTGLAYDTLQNTITGDYCGSMKSYGIGYRQVDLKNGEPDLPAIKQRRQMRISSWYSSSAAAATASARRFLSRKSAKSARPCVRLIRLRPSWSITATVNSLRRSSRRRSVRTSSQARSSRIRAAVWPRPAAILQAVPIWLRTPPTS